MPKTKKTAEKGQPYMWAFTWWTEGDTNKDILIQWLQQYTKKWIFQQERGGESNNLHFQGHFSLIDRARLSELVTRMKDLNQVKQVHLSPVGNGNEKASFSYCLKDETRVDGPWTDKDKPRFIPKEWNNDPVLPWHEVVLDILNTQNRRQILFVYDQIGGTGKTILKNRIKKEGMGFEVPATMGTADKVMQCVYGQMDGRIPDRRYTVVVDCPRSIPKGKTFWYELAGALEKIKDGSAYDWRHQWKEIYFTSPRLVVFTNVLPPRDCLSEDRWQVFSPPRAPPPPAAGATLAQGASPPSLSGDTLPDLEWIEEEVLEGGDFFPFDGTCV